jgi:hypothetical protein
MTPTKPRYHLLSDEEMDDRASAAMERMFEARRLRRARQRFEAELFEAVRDINSNVIRLNPNN